MERVSFTHCCIKLWYDYQTLAPFKPGKVSVATPLDKIPVFLRGGSIVPRRQRVRRAASLMTNDPFTLVVALDENVSDSFSLNLLIF